MIFSNLIYNYSYVRLKDFLNTFVTIQHPLFFRIKIVLI